MTLQAILGPSSPPRKGHSSTLFSAHVYCGHGRPSQLLLSSYWILVNHSKSSQVLPNGSFRSFGQCKMQQTSIIVSHGGTTFENLYFTRLKKCKKQNNFKFELTVMHVAAWLCSSVPRRLLQVYNRCGQSPAPPPSKSPSAHRATTLSHQLRPSSVYCSTACTLLQTIPVIRAAKTPLLL